VKLHRLAILVVIMALFTWTDGITGMWVSAILFGLLCQLYYSVTDTWNKITKAARRPVYNVDNKTQNLNVYTGGMPGTPTHDDWAAINEERKSRKQQ
jgi:hypothetical protein